MTTENAIVTRSPGAIMPASEPPAIAQIIQSAMDRGIRSEDVQAVKELVALDREMRQDRARIAFAAAFKALQAETPQIKATKIIPDKHGNAKFTIAPFEEIMDAVQPLLDRHGFSITFTSDYQANPIRVIVRCTLIHESGHERTTDIAIRVGDGPPGSSAAQADGAAITFGKRYALCGALNIVIDRDSDARGEGDLISLEEAGELERRVRSLGADRARILKLAAATSFEQIRRAKYDVVCEHLDRMKPAPPVEASDDPFTDLEAFQSAIDNVAKGRAAFSSPEVLDAVLGAAMKKRGYSTLAHSPVEFRREFYTKLNSGQLDGVAKKSRPTP